MHEKAVEYNAILQELQALRTEMGRFIIPGIGFSKDHSDWSAHAKWSSGSKNLLGDFDLTARIGLPSTAAQLDKIIADTSSTRFLEVAKSLQDMVVEK